MKLSEIQIIEKMQIMDSNTSRLMPYQLTHWEKRSQIQFAINQLKKYETPYQLRLQDSFGLCAVFVDTPEYLGNYNGFNKGE